MISIQSAFPGGFTVLIAVYDKTPADLFARAIESVYDNELKPDRMILVVDGPISAQLECQCIVAQRHYGTVVVRRDVNKGLAAALNFGLSYVRTEWVVRADADDYNLPQRFARISELLGAHPELDLVGSALLELERDGKPAARRVVPLHHDQIKKFMIWRNPFNHQTVAFRRSLAERVGGYPNIYYREDYGLWITMIKAGAKCANLPEVLVHATAGREMYIRRGGWRYACGECQLQALMVNLGFKSRLRAALDGIARSAVFLVPSFIRRLIYMRILRDPIVR
jgi:glycosyltransferase involved in cell wall biosynthesis